LSISYFNENLAMLMIRSFILWWEL
jgi:hypothetical protein